MNTERDQQHDRRQRRAEADPAGLTDDVLVTRVEISSSPLRPLLMTQTRSKARSDSMTVTTRTMMLIGRITGKTTWKNVLHLAGAVDRGRLAQRRVDALQPGQVEQHDVADVPPARGDQRPPRG